MSAASISLSAPEKLVWPNVSVRLCSDLTGTTSNGHDDSTRDRVRALVRDVLEKAAPETPDPSTPDRFVNTVPETAASACVHAR